MSCIYKNKNTMRLCAKEGNVGVFCPGSGAFMSCYTTEDMLPDVKVVERPPYCKFCFNARVYEPTEEEQMNPFNTELTDDNDSSSIVVGKHMRPYRSIMINSGHGEPLNIEFLEWAVTRERWETVGKYYPKFCPECGRRLDEYDEDKM